MEDNMKLKFWGCFVCHLTFNLEQMLFPCGAFFCLFNVDRYNHFWSTNCTENANRGDFNKVFLWIATGMCVCVFSGRLATSVYSFKVPVMLRVEPCRMQLFGCQMRSRTTQKAGSWRARLLGGANTAEWDWSLFILLAGSQCMWPL